MKRILPLFLVLCLLATASCASFADDAAVDFDSIPFGDLFVKTTAFTINGRAYSPAEINYNYFNQFYQFYNMYSSYASYMGLDTSLGLGGLAGQACALSQDGSSWKDYFLAMATEAMVTNQALLDYADENGITLSEDELAAIETDLADAEELAASYGFTSVDQLMEANYGSGCTAELMKKMTTDYALASKAYNTVKAGIVITDEQVLAEAPSVNVRHILIKAEADENGEFTDEALAAAKAKADEIYAEWQAGEATEESFAALAEQYSEDPGSNTAGGLYENVSEGQMVQEFNDFCFDASRQAGDTGIVYGNNGSYAGYHIMYFSGAGDIEVGRAQLLSSALTAAIDALAEGYEVEYGPYYKLAGLFI